MLVSVVVYFGVRSGVSVCLGILGCVGVLMCVSVCLCVCLFCFGRDWHLLNTLCGIFHLCNFTRAGTAFFPSGPLGPERLTGHAHNANPPLRPLPLARSKVCHGFPGSRKRAPRRSWIFSGDAPDKSPPLRLRRPRPAAQLPSGLSSESSRGWRWLWEDRSPESSGPNWGSAPSRPERSLWRFWEPRSAGDR